MGMVDFPRVLSIEWLREKYVTKEMTPEDTVREIIDRAQEDAEMNIWITPPAMEIIQPYLDRLRSLDPAKTPLWGIPFAVKDNIDLAGIPTTAGCPDYEYTPGKSATVVQRLVDAGAIPVGKANLDQFATGLVGTRSPFGETHNSLREELISGGSSSGSAVAVARGHAAFGLGTDTAGSGRVPAALNGLVGYKPSFGAWPVKGVVPACESLDCVTVFAHSLEDALTVDCIARGPSQTDPWSRSLPYPSSKVPSKIYLPQQSPEFFGPYAKAYSDAWQSSVERLGKLGIVVEFIDVHLFSQAAALLYEGPFVAERWAGLGAFIEAHPGSALSVTEQILRSGLAAEYSAASLFKAMHRLQAYKLAVGKLLADAVLVMPTAGGTWTREQVRLDPIVTNREMGRYTNHCNLLDLCAVAVPSDAAAFQLPFGISMFALAKNEDLICGAAKSFLNQTVELNTRRDAETTASSAPNKNTTLVAVCGLHMRGYALEKQMLSSGARFVREGRTAPKYAMVKLPTAPAKPGLIKRPTGGASLQLELWEMPLDAFGSFAASIPAPLGMGKVELEDGLEVPGFICEGYAAAGAEDITSLGGWRNVR